MNWLAERHYQIILVLLLIADHGKVKGLHTPSLIRPKQQPRGAGTYVSQNYQTKTRSLLTLLSSSKDPTKTQTNGVSESRSIRTVNCPNTGEIEVISRTVPITDDWEITVWEQNEPSLIVEDYWELYTRSVPVLDPFGLILWPGSVIAAQEMKTHESSIQNATVLILGAGTGIEAQAAAQLGAKKVIATDIHPKTLDLLNYGAAQAGLEHIIQTEVFNLFGDQNLPACDILVMADVMYGSKLALQVGCRCFEALRRPQRPKILITDSQRFHGTDFLPNLRAAMKEEIGEWKDIEMEEFTGSGVMVDEDQTYDVKARLWAYGW